MQIKHQNIALADFKDFLFNKNVPLSNLKDHKGIALEKILAFWRRHKLLPFIPESKWLEISFAQLIWIRILDDLRSINYPAKKMTEVCDYFFKDAYFNELAKKNLEINRESIKKRVQSGTQSEEDEKMLDYIAVVLQNPVLLTIFKFDINYLSHYIAACISNSEDGNIYIFFDGTVAEFIGATYWGHKYSHPDFSKPHIRLTVSNYLKEFINDDELSELLMPQLLNDDEMTVLKEMRRKNISEIHINRTKDLSQWTIKTSESGVFTTGQAKEIKEMLGLKNYESIELKTIDNKSLFFKVTRKNIKGSD